MAIYFCITSNYQLIKQRNIYWNRETWSFETQYLEAWYICYSYINQMLSCAVFIISKCYNVLCSRVQLLDLVLYCPAIAQTTGTHNFDKFPPFTHLVNYKNLQRSLAFVWLLSQPLSQRSSNNERRINNLGHI